MQAMAESVEPDPTALARNTQLIEDGVKDFLERPASVTWTANRVGENQLLPMAHEVPLEFVLHNGRHR
jgi:hypothetical protein